MTRGEQLLSEKLATGMDGIRSRYSAATADPPLRFAPVGMTRVGGFAGYRFIEKERSRTFNRSMNSSDGWLKIWFSSGAFSASEHQQHQGDSLTLNAMQLNLLYDDLDRKQGSLR
jgi:hypothetical protein